MWEEPSVARGGARGQQPIPPHRHARRAPRDTLPGGGTGGGQQRPPWCRVGGHRLHARPAVWPYACPSCARGCGGPPPDPSTGDRSRAAVGAGQASFSRRAGTPLHLHRRAPSVTAMRSPVADAGGPPHRWCRLAAKRRRRALWGRVPAARGPWLRLVVGGGGGGGAVVAGGGCRRTTPPPPHDQWFRTHFFGPGGRGAVQSPRTPRAGPSANENWAGAWPTPQTFGRQCWDCRALGVVLLLRDTVHRALDGGVMG